jgi:hypothetical protein
MCKQPLTNKNSPAANFLDHMIRPGQKRCTWPRNQYAPPPLTIWRNGTGITIGKVAACAVAVETVIKTASRTNKAPYAANKPLVTKTHKHHRVWKSTRKNSTVSASRRKFSSAGAEGTSMTLSCQEAYTMLPRGGRTPWNPRTESSAGMEAEPPQLSSPIFSSQSATLPTSPKFRLSPPILHFQLAKATRKCKKNRL